MLEYSELDPQLASAANPATGLLFYNWSNICMHYFSVAWLQRVAKALLEGHGTAYHVARKKIPSVAGPVGHARVARRRAGCPGAMAC